MNNFDKNEKTKYNLSRILRSIWLTEGISRIELGKKLNMDKATTSTLVSLLIKNKIVIEQRQKLKSAGPGRRPIGLTVADNFGYVIGFEYHINGIRAVVTDLHHNILVEKTFERFIKGDIIEQAFFESYEEIIHLPQLKNIPILGIGVSIPGIINHDNGTITDSWELGIIEEPYDFYTHITSKMNIPLFLENNANCCACGILAKYRAKEYKYFLYAYIGFENMQDRYTDEIDHISIGFGIVLDGKLFQGPDYTAGEFQTIRYAEDRVNQFTMTKQEQIDFRSNSEIRIKMIEDLADHLALFVNMFNFKQIFFGGDLELIPDETKDIVENAIKRNWSYSKNIDCEIQIMKGQKSPAALGAAGMLLDQLFSIPDLNQDNNSTFLNKVLGLD